MVRRGSKKGIRGKVFVATKWIANALFVLSNFFAIEDTGRRRVMWQGKIYD
jgi:hypothetical protein